MKGTLVENARPLQLAQRGGRWTLELECLVPISRDILRPVRKMVEGRDHILYHLENTASSRDLVTGAGRIMDGAAAIRPGEDRAFEPREGHWVPALATNPELDGGAGPGGARPAAAADPPPSELKRAMTLLVESNERLTRKVVRLEERINHLLELIEQGALRHGSLPPMSPIGGPPSVAPVSISPTAPKSESLRPDYQVPKELASDQRVRTMPPAKSVPPVKSVRPGARKSLAPAASKLKLPSLKEVATVARQLIGDKIKLAEPKKQVIHFGSDVKNLYGCSIVDDQNNTVGAMVCDARGSIIFGSTLLMLPTRQVDEQLAADRPIGDVVEALSEIFNTLSALVNNVPGNPHVRSTPAAIFEHAQYRWANSALKRLDLEDTAGGRITILSK